MKSPLSSFRGIGSAVSLAVTLCCLALLPYGSASAQAPAVPPTFQSIYTSLDNYLTNFNTTLNAGPVVNTALLGTGNLKNANANAGPQLVNSTAGVALQLQELKSMGVQAIMVEVGFPVLYAPFLTSQGQSYTQFVAFYQQVASMVRAAGLKLIVENDTLLSADAQAGWTTAPFYATLNWTEYQQARAQMALTVAQTMQPDYLVVLEEPDTEAANTGQTNVNTPSGATSMLTQELASVQAADLPNMKVGAGVGTWLSGYLAFIQDFVALPVNFIDMHVYPVNDNLLPNAMQIAATAAAAGKPVAMTECWMWKVSNSELGVLSPDTVRGRDPFSFWAPLDALFIQTMQNMGHHTQMLFMDPFNSEDYTAYLPYDAATENLSPTAILDQQSAQAVTNMGLAMYTSTATSFYASLVSPADKVPPSVPAGVTGVSANPTTATVSWIVSTDNVGVAGYYVLRNGSTVATTANVYFQDTGLTEGTTYTYTIEAFDLGGNISAPSLRVTVTTKDTTPPTPPGNLVAIAVSSQMVTLTWSPSVDNAGISSYIVSSGTSVATLAVAGHAPATPTSYTISSLTAGTTYYFGVEAEDADGNISTMSTIVSVTTPKPPAAPTGLVATAVSPSAIGLTWNASVGGGLPILNYRVYRGTTNANLVQLAIVLVISYTDSTVTPGTTYYYAVEAADTGSDLSPMSAIVSATTLALPEAPTSLMAISPAGTQVNLSWLAGKGGLPVASYDVFRGSSPSNLTSLKVIGATPASTTDTTVTAGATYYYAIQETDTGGNISPMSIVVGITTP
jgi:fibronectin type 3 domain-containing protein